MTDFFDVDSLWLSPIIKDVNTNFFCSFINYKEKNSLVIETPIIVLTHLDLVYKNQSIFHKIAVKVTLDKESQEFQKVISTIDEKLRNISPLHGKFVSSISSNDTYSFFIPVYRNEVSILVIKDNQHEKLSTLQKNTRCRLTLLLSHIEAANDIVMPIWNIIEIRCV